MQLNLYWSIYKTPKEVHSQNIRQHFKILWIPLIIRIVAASATISLSSHYLQRPQNSLEAQACAFCRSLSPCPYFSRWFLQFLLHSSLSSTQPEVRPIWIGSFLETMTIQKLFLSQSHYKIFVWSEWTFSCVTECRTISMGQGQEVHARKLIQMSMQQVCSKGLCLLTHCACCSSGHLVNLGPPQRGVKHSACDAQSFLPFLFMHIESTCDYLWILNLKLGCSCQPTKSMFHFV